jgi:hypothetical protein
MPNEPEVPETFKLGFKFLNEGKGRNIIFWMTRTGLCGDFKLGCFSLGLNSLVLMF